MFFIYDIIYLLSFYYEIPKKYLEKVLTNMLEPFHVFITKEFFKFFIQTDLCKSV